MSIIDYIGYNLLCKSLLFFIQDSWNSDVLTKGPLQKQKETSVLFQTLRGRNGDLRAYRGYDPDINKEEFFYPFPGYTLYNTKLGTIISWIPFALILISLIFGNARYRKIQLFWIGIFVINLFFYKSSAAPFGFVFERLLNDIGIFSIFRNPHQKLGIIFVISQMMILLYAVQSISNFHKQRLFLSVIIIFSCFSGYFWIFGTAIPKINLVKNIPNEYSLSANYLNSYHSIKRMGVLPYNESTRINTNYGYEGYSLFHYLLPQKQLRNRNDITFSSYNALFMHELGPIFQKLDGNLISKMQKLNIDTLIYDGYTDRYPRFRYQENHTGNLQFLKNSGLELEKQFDKISIRKLPAKYIQPMISIQNSVLTKIVNPTKYRLSLSIPSNATGEELRFLQSFHKEWKLYPGRPLTCSGETIVYSGSSYRGDELIPITYAAVRGDNRRRIASKNGIDLDLLELYNTGVKTVFPIGQKFIVGYDEGSGNNIPYGTTIECITSGYTFFQGEELSYLWKKPLRDESHSLVNEYANGREIDLQKQVTSSKKQEHTITYLQKGLEEGRISKNPDGSYQLHLVMYFHPQSRFYLGLIISGLTLLSLLGCLGWSWVRKTIKKN